MTEKKPAEMGLIESAIIFLAASLLMFLMTKYLIPWLSAVTGQEIILFWFLVAGLGIFTPLIITAIIILKAEGCKLNKETWTERMRFRKLSGRDLLLTAGGIISILILSGLIMKGMETLLGRFDTTPSFMSLEPLSKGRYWLLAVWFPYWLLNILGEEILWRGVMLPRQEIVFGKCAWLIHAVGWGLFHIAFGWQLLVTLIPIIFIQSFIVQKTKNSWTGVIIHGLINGPSFIAISLGLL